VLPPPGGARVVGRAPGAVRWVPGSGSTFPAPRLAQSGERPSPSESDLGPQGINAGAAMPSPFIVLGRAAGN
jgi:hypothetical protein